MIEVFETQQKLIEKAAQDFEATANELLSTKSSIRVLLTGGTLGIEFIRAMGSLDLDYSRVWMMFSDERFVKLDHFDRNEWQGIQAWPDLAKYLTRYPDAEQPLESARIQFDAELKPVFEDGLGFDITILGMGPDGHVASLFPGHQAPGDWLIAEPDSPKPPAERLSLSYRALALSKRVWFLAAGDSKAEAVNLALNTDSVPASRVRGSEETRWYLDKALSDAL